MYRTADITSKVSESQENFVETQLTTKEYFSDVCYECATKRREL
jgi:hypothetical protein